MTEPIDPFTELLGAYALDAVDADERDAIAAHLTTCPRCRAEVAEHRETAAFLSQSGAPAPDGVWDRIAADLSPPAPPLRVRIDPEDHAGRTGPGPADAPPSASVVSLDDARRHRLRTRTLVAVISAAAVVVAVLGIVTVNQSRRLDRLQTAMDNVSVDRLANQTVGRASLQVHLVGAGATAQAVVDRSGRGYLITAGLRVPMRGDVYQLWGKVDGKVLSLGTFGGSTPVVPFQLDSTRLGGVQAFAVTEERAPGVVASTRLAVIAGTV